MSTRIPSTYANASKLSADSRGALACARLVWESLTKEEQLMLRDACAGLVYSGRTRTRARLVSRGLAVDTSAPYRKLLTSLGELVREAGIRTPVEMADA